MERLPERLHERHPHQLVRADDPRDRGVRGPRRATRAATCARGSWRSACASRRRFACRATGARHRHSDPRSENQLHAPGWVTNMATPRQRHAPVGGPEGGPRPLLRVARARAARPARRRRSRAWCSACARSRDSPFFRYPERAPQPDQLLGRAARLRGQHDRRPGACCATTTGASSCASCGARSGPRGRGGSRTSGRATTSTATRSSAPGRSRTSSRPSTRTSCSTSSTTTSRRGARG